MRESAIARAKANQWECYQILTNIKEQANDHAKPTLNSASKMLPQSTTPPMNQLAKQSFDSSEKQRCTQSYGPT
jgi:hypothetical protein